MGAPKRLGKMSARGRAGMSGECPRRTSNTPGVGGREAGAGDGTVATGAVILPEWVDVRWGRETGRWRRGR